MRYIVWVDYESGQTYTREPVSVVAPSAMLACERAERVVAESRGGRLEEYCAVKVREAASYKLVRRTA